MSAVSPRMRRRVMIVCQYWEERFLHGVAAYAREKGWVLDIALRHSRRIDLLPPNWSGHGVIANTGGNAALADYIATLKLPVVLAQSGTDIPGAPTVMHDEAEIGRIAARYFLGLNFERFVFVAYGPSLGSPRGDGFLEAARAAGRTAERIDIDALPGRLAALRPPVAMLTVNDTCALQALSAITHAGIDVPRDVALMGVDDDELLCTLGAVPLTSVNLDFEGRGRACAELLDRMMEDRRAARPLITPIRGVTVRESTDTVAIPSPGAARALRYIRENYRRPINLKEVEDAVGGSLRGVQEVFKKHVGRTLAGELARLRREAGLELLKNPKLKVETIATECGYAGRFHFARALARETGKTPQAWRRQFKAERAAAEPPG